MYKLLFKRLIDIFISIVLLPFLFILVLIIGIFIYIEDKGPIFYKAPRIGKDRKVFHMIKFRSMKLDAPDIRNEDGSTYNSENDSRVTKVGSFMRKSSIDEIPQILNVIVGDMSIIGPRPPLPESLDMYNNYEKTKFEIRPGITGYNQAFYRNSVSQNERIKNDIYYVNNITFGLDIKILMITIKNLVKKKNIYSNHS